MLLALVDTRYSVDAPLSGGTFTEGVVGTLRFINPVLAFSESDKDLTALVFSGLLKLDKNGMYGPDLAESFTISDDGRVYTFKLGGDRHFHDKTPITADDVLFTIGLIKDDRTKSPLATSWAGITAAKIDDQTLTLTLDKPYSPVLENTTVGILPMHIWQEIRPEEMLFSSRNLEAVGSGPYRVTKIKRTQSGIPEEIRLRAFGDSRRKTPYISKLSIKIFSSEDDLVKALSRRTIDAAARLSPEHAKEFEGKSFTIHTAPLPRIFAVFFNPKHNTVLAHKEVREALTLATDKNKITDEVLSGFGTPLEGPFSFGGNTPIDADSVKKILEGAGWKRNQDGIFEKTISGKKEVLSFELHTSNAPELVKTAELLKSMWRGAGINIIINFFETGDLNQESIRTRNFDMLLFGQYQGRFPDPYAFWHSSQRDDPGLNVALYASKEADVLLEKIRTEKKEDIRAGVYREFDDRIKRDVPAVFLYSPNLIYIFSKKVDGITLSLGAPQDRFTSISNWYTRTDRVWNVFAAQND